MRGLGRQLSTSTPALGGQDLQFLWLDVQAEAVMGGPAWPPPALYGVESVLGSPGVVQRRQRRQVLTASCMAYTAEAGIALEVSTTTKTGAFGGRTRYSARSYEYRHTSLIIDCGLTSTGEGLATASPATIRWRVKVFHAASGMYPHCFMELAGEAGKRESKHRA